MKSLCLQSKARRRQYSRRMGIVEPVFANITTVKRLDRFTLRGRAKVRVQWLLYALVHNIEKIAHYGTPDSPPFRRKGPKNQRSRR